MAFFAGRPGGNWNILVPFNSGTFRVEAEDTSARVHYRLSTVRILVAITAVLGLLLGIMIAGSFRHDWLSAAKMLGLGWLWLFGMNYLIGTIRIPIWLKRGLRKIGG